MLKKYIGDRKFYATAMAVAVPIMIQNAITNFVGMLDNIMVGQVGTARAFSPPSLPDPGTMRGCATPFASRSWCVFC